MSSFALSRGIWGGDGGLEGGEKREEKREKRGEEKMKVSRKFDYFLFSKLFHHVYASFVRRG